MPRCKLGWFTMATIQKIGNSYSIRVNCEYDTQGKQVVQSKTWTLDEGMTERQILKELERQRVLLDEECKKGFQSKAVKFETLCEEWFAEYAKTNLRHTTYSYLYHQRLRINKAIVICEWTRSPHGRYKHSFTRSQKRWQTRLMVNRSPRSPFGTISTLYRTYSVMP